MNGVCEIDENLYLEANLFRIITEKILMNEFAKLIEVRKLF